MREADIQARIMLALSAAGCLIWRQNTGAMRGDDGRLIRFGLCVGSSDIIGMSPDGRFLAVEVKRLGGRTSAAQVRFIAAVNLHGGRAGIARCESDAVAIATS